MAAWLHGCMAAWLHERTMHHIAIGLSKAVMSMGADGERSQVPVTAGPDVCRTTVMPMPSVPAQPRLAMGTAAPHVKDPSIWYLHLGRALHRDTSGWAEDEAGALFISSRFPYTEKKTRGT